MSAMCNAACLLTESTTNSVVITSPTRGIDATVTESKYFFPLKINNHDMRYFGFVNLQWCPSQVSTCIEQVSGYFRLRDSQLFS